MIKIIALSGKQFAGKDTIARHLLLVLPDFKRVGIADAIKLEYSKNTGLSLNEIESNKYKYRSDLINLGNKGREINPTYWLSKVLDTKDNIIIPDVRLKSEFGILRGLGALLIRVEAAREARELRGVLTNEDDITETDLDDFDNSWDLIIDNTPSHVLKLTN